MTDIVERLRERIDTMIAERDAERITYNDAIADLIADNERLRAALQEIANMGTGERVRIARRALGPSRLDVAPDVAPAPQSKSKT